MPTLTEDIHWITHRRRYSPLEHGRHSAIINRRATVSPTEYLTVKNEYGEWRWELFTYKHHDVTGRARLLDGGAKPTMAAAKAAAVAAWEARP